MDTRSKQELFEIAVRGVYAQGRQSISKTGQCRYRGPGGTKCAVGHLIDDETALRFEGSGAHMLTEEFPLATVPLLSALQAAHDTSTKGDFRDVWVDRCTEIAQDHGLTMPVLE
jgi:hypothetical protein